jgi:hypothetical protein
MTRKYPLPKLPSGDEYPSLEDATTTERAAVVDSSRRDPEPEVDPEAEPAPASFNPYGFSVLTVPPDLRREMVHAKLPRLDPKYFQDTVPPHHALEAPPPSDGEPEAVTPVVKRGPLLIVLIACLFGISVCLAFTLLRSPAPPREATSAVTKAIEPAAGPSQVAPPAMPVPATPAPAAVISATAGPGAPAKSPIQQGLRVGQPTAASPARAPRAAPGPAETSNSARPALTSLPPASSPPAPLQPSWVTPR